MQRPPLKEHPLQPDLAWQRMSISKKVPIHHFVAHWLEVAASVPTDNWHSKGLQRTSTQPNSSIQVKRICVEVDNEKSMWDLIMTPVIDALLHTLFWQQIDKSQDLWKYQVITTKTDVPPSGQSCRKGKPSWTSLGIQEISGNPYSSLKSGSWQISVPPNLRKTLTSTTVADLDGCKLCPFSLALPACPRVLHIVPQPLTGQCIRQEPLLDNDPLPPGMVCETIRTWGT